MSIEAENSSIVIEDNDYLLMILNELKLLNARIESAFETRIREEDINYDD